MLKGSEVYKLILGEVEHRRSYLVKNSGDFAQLNSELTELLEKRGQLYEQLSRLLLPDLQSQLVDTVLAETRINLDSLKAESETLARNALEEYQSEAKTNKQLQEELQILGKELSTLADERDRLEQESVTLLKGDSEFVKLCEELAAEEGRIRLYRGRLEEINAEKDKNILAYEQDPFFTYLYRRNFLQANYSSYPLFATLDSFVARTTSYKRNLEKYQALLFLPKQMEEEIIRIEKEREVTFKKVDEIQKQVFTDNGLHKLAQIGEEKGGVREELLNKAQVSSEKLKVLEKKLSSVNEHTGDLYSQVIKLLVDKFPDLSIGKLSDLAKKTPTISDDRLVATIKELQNQLATRQDKLQGLKNTQQALERDADLFENLTKSFIQADYDSERSCFNLTKDELFDILANKDLDEHSLWQSLVSRQQFDRGWMNNRNDDFFNGDLTRVFGAVLEGVVRIGLSELSRSSRGHGGGFTSTSFPSLKGGRGFSSGDGF
jgi:DNA repair exonuclease SbcCD ATPase subunit